MFSPFVRSLRARRLVLVPIAFFLLGTAWAFASPLGSAADDDYHLANIWCAWGASDLCQFLEDEFLGEKFTVIPEIIRESTCYVYSGPTGRPTDAGCLDGYGTNLVVANRVAATNEERFNYAPGYYPIMRLFAGENIQFSVQVMRLFNVILASLLLAAALRLASEPVRRAIGYSWGLLISPIGIFFIASTSPSSWAITGMSLSWIFTWVALSPSQPRKVRLTAALGLFVSILMVSAARPTSLAFVAVVIMGVIVSRVKDLRRWLLLGLAVGGAALIALAAALIYRRWGSNFSFVGAHTGTDMPAPLVRTALEVPAILFAFVGGQRPSFVMRDTAGDALREGYSSLSVSFGHGWTENVLPSLVGLTLGCVAFFAVLTGISYAPWWRRVGVSLVAAAIPATVFLAQASDAYGSTPIQPRYLFGLFIAAAGLALVATGREPKFFSRFQIAALGTIVWLATTIAWLQTSSRYSVGPQATYTNFGQEPGWWWAPFPGRLASTAIVAVITATWIFLALLSSRSLRQGGKQFSAVD